MNLLATAELEDRAERWPVRDSACTLQTGRVISVRRDVVAPAAGETFVRDVVVHPGSVGILALDRDDNVLLVAQYRHPVGHRLLEPPAGLLDVPGEDLLKAAQRELCEETHLRARDWRLLVDAFSSPGVSDERIQVFLARDLEPAEDSSPQAARHEEADMTVCWAGLDAVVAAILAGRVHNPVLIMGALAVRAAAAQLGGLDALPAVGATPR